MKNLPTLPANRSASAEDLFQRLALRYGKHWLDMWVGLPLEKVKLEWGGALATFHRIQVEQAINHLGKFPPTLPEFVALCSEMPRPFVARTADQDGPKLVTDKIRPPIPESFKQRVDALFKRGTSPKTAQQIEEERQRQLEAVKRIAGGDGAS